MSMSDRYLLLCLKLQNSAKLRLLLCIPLFWNTFVPSWQPNVVTDTQEKVVERLSGKIFKNVTWVICAKTEYVFVKFLHYFFIRFFSSGRIVLKNFRIVFSLVAKKIYISHSSIFYDFFIASFKFLVLQVSWVSI